MNIELIQAKIDDALEILMLQQIADQKEDHLDNEWNTLPVSQTLSELQKEFETSVFVKATLDGKIVGSVRGKTRSDTCMIDRLIVHPEFQREDIGTSLMQSIEVLFPSARRFEVSDDTMSTDNIRLYETLGYAAYRQEDLSPEVSVVFMEKTI